MTVQGECRFCGHVVEGEDAGAMLEALAEHGEAQHEFHPETGWSP